jgi:hypothetical protein
MTIAASQYKPNGFCYNSRGGGEVGGRRPKRRMEGAPSKACFGSNLITASRAGLPRPQGCAGERVAPLPQLFRNRARFRKSALPKIRKFGFWGIRELGNSESLEVGKRGNERMGAYLRILCRGEIRISESPTSRIPQSPNFQISKTMDSQRRDGRARWPSSCGLPEAPIIPISTAAARKISRCAQATLLKILRVASK